MLRLAIRVDRECAEFVLAELLELAPSGVEEVDVDERTIEYAVYGPPGELPELPDLEAAAQGSLVQVSTTEIADDWSERWREFHRPLVLGDKLTVRPPWEPPHDTALDIVIDPAQAFGTGAHATTRLCLEMLLTLDSGDGLLDLGCGSGVLAIVAAKLGRRPVTAVDFDPLSVEATRANAAANGVDVQVARADLRTDPIPAAPLVTANLLAPLLATWIARIKGGSPTPEMVIASGLLEHETDRIAAEFQQVGLVEWDRRTASGWSAVLMQRA